MSGTFAVGTVSNDPSGDAASNHGTFTVSQTSTTVSRFKDTTLHFHRPSGQDDSIYATSVR